MPRTAYISLNPDQPLPRGWSWGSHVADPQRGREGYYVIQTVPAERDHDVIAWMRPDASVLSRADAKDLLAAARDGLSRPGNGVTIAE